MFMRVNYNNKLRENIIIPKVSQVNNKDFQKGQILKGEIRDINQKNILIKLTNGASLIAKLTNEMEFSIGQKVLFEIKDSNPERILLKPVIDENINPKNDKLFQVLEEANVTVNEKNVEIVNKLLDNNMPLDKEFINNIIRLSRQFKDTSIDKLIILLKNNIPVTKESIEQLNNYVDNNNSIKQEIIGLSNEIIDNNDLKTKQELIKILTSSSNNLDVNANGDNQNNIESMSIEKEGTFNQISNTNANESNAKLSTMQLGSIISKTAIKELESEIKSTYLQKTDSLNLSKETTLQQLQEKIFELNIKQEKQVNINKHITNKLLSSAVDESIYLGKEALENPKLVNDYFNNIYEKLVNIIKLSQSAVGKTSSLTKDAIKVKNNIEFMNNLNNNYNYVQLPFKFNNKLLNSELYIFENKKELRKKRDGDSISALLRLDYLNLGHMDVYVAKQAKNIGCKFYVEDEEKKAVINNHINKLYKKIKNFNYNITEMMVINKNKEFDFVEDFINKKNKSKSVKRYTFDMRV
jgi:hypothetical protein